MYFDSMRPVEDVLAVAAVGPRADILTYLAVKAMMSLVFAGSALSSLSVAVDVLTYVRWLKYVREALNSGCWGSLGREKEITMVSCSGFILSG